MPAFGKASQEKLATCDPRLQAVFNEIIRHFDCVVLEGHRGQAAQDAAYAKGNSKLKWPHGKHNRQPSIAVDVIPHPVDWRDTARITYFAGQVVATARSMGIALRWGGDWNGDTQLKDNSFDDLVHFELTN